MAYSGRFSHISWNGKKPAKQKKIRALCGLDVPVVFIDSQMPVCPGCKAVKAEIKRAIEFDVKSAAIQQRESKRAQSMKRSSGFYRVYDRYSAGWITAEWNADQDWWVLPECLPGDPAFPSGVCGDSRFDQIGERIP